jgi:hypothetical protein
MGFLNIILALLLPYIFDIGMYGVALAGLITLSSSIWSDKSAFYRLSHTNTQNAPT